MINESLSAFMQLGFLLFEGGWKWETVLNDI